MRTPLVIAMWEQFARALGWPQKKIGFEEILRLARSGAPIGPPEFGRFKLVHTNPDFSTSGLSAVVAEYYAATGKKEGLTVQDVTSSKAREVVRDIERSIVHYGDTTLFIAEQMKREGPGYASAVAMEEVTLLDFNRTRGSQQPLVALYPPEGTFYSDNPYIVLNAPWVSAAERRGAKEFGEFLAEEIDPELAAQSGFRPADLDEQPVPPVSKENGADPSQPERVLGLPDPRVLDAIKRAWRRGPQARQHPAGGGHLRLDERPGPPAARQGGPRGLLPRGVDERPRGADDLLRRDPAARADRRRSRRTGSSCGPRSIASSPTAARRSSTPRSREWRPCGR